MAFDLFAAVKNEKAIMQLHKKLGEVYVSKGQYVKALDSFTKFLIEAQAQKNNKEIAIALRDIGIVYFKKGDYEKSVEYFNQSLKFDDALIVKKLIQDAYLKIVTVSSFKKEYEKADTYHELYRNLKGELRKNKAPDAGNTDDQLAEKEKIIELLSKQNEEQNKILTQQDYELSQQLTATEIERQSKEKALEELNLTTEEKKKKEAELEQMSAEKAKQELLLSQKEVMLVKQEKFRNILLFASGIILLAAFFLFNRYKLKKRSLEELNKAHEELNQAHNKLKQTQQQLIQSEKMASLGQLTAGIAHEIQNPLNFVNNFSKMSVELLDELQKEKNDEVLNDLKINLTKINHHGNRISEIVKGMLLHSRNAPTEKQLADLNALVDESLHLAFHGRRSSESDFNCLLEKNYDSTLPPIHIIQQDVRRVVINIINNAFYAVQKKYEMMRADNHKTEFIPKVSVFTTRQNGSAVIKVRDNGLGIPDEIKEKIFNPFFTSKPTGEGTGLGLSVSYDIVTKAHNGVIRFETEKNAGSTFFVELPIN